MIDSSSESKQHCCPSSATTNLSPPAQKLQQDVNLAVPLACPYQQHLIMMVETRKRTAAKASTPSNPIQSPPPKRATRAGSSPRTNPTLVVKLKIPTKPMNEGDKETAVKSTLSKGSTPHAAIELQVVKDVIQGNVDGSVQNTVNDVIMGSEPASTAARQDAPDAEETAVKSTPIIECTCNAGIKPRRVWVITRGGKKIIESTIKNNDKGAKATSTAARDDALHSRYMTPGLIEHPIPPYPLIRPSSPVLERGVDESTATLIDPRDYVYRPMISRFHEEEYRAMIEGSPKQESQPVISQPLENPAADLTGPMISQPRENPAVEFTGLANEEENSKDSDVTEVEESTNVVDEPEESESDGFETPGESDESDE